MAKLRVVVLIGGPSAEHEVSIRTGRKVLRGLDNFKYEISKVVVPKLLKSFGFLDKILERKPDVVFLAMHGTFGEDGVIQGVLDALSIPYTGSGVLSSALATDKVKSYELFKSAGIPVPKHISLFRSEWIEAKNSVCKKIFRSIGMPCVVKPANLGSSVGVSIVRRENEFKKAMDFAFKKSDRVIVDQYIAGREVTCGVLDDGVSGSEYALPPTEITPKVSKFFDYRAKYEKGGSTEITPARFSHGINSLIQKNALAAHRLLGCSGMSRTDMIVQSRIRKQSKTPKIYVLETNTIPGMTETSLLPKAAMAAGISFPGLLDRLISAALNKKSART